NLTITGGGTNGSHLASIAMTFDSNFNNQGTLSIDGSTLSNVNSFTVNASVVTTGSFVITGSSVADTIKGGSGNDTIAGGVGADALTGGAGADHFVYNTTSDSTVANHDTITDFVHNTDKIDFSAIIGIANTSQNGNNFFQGVINGSTNVAADSIALVQSGSDTLVYGNDTTSAVSQGSAHLEIVLTGVTASTLTASDFLHH